MAPLTTFKSVEIPSISNLKKIIAHWDNLEFARQDDPLPKLKEYLSNAKDGKVPVTYAHSAKAKISGRQFVRGGCGLQSFQKAIRHTIGGDAYRDYDMVNAHPVILNQYCDKNGISHQFLSGYVKGRDAIIDVLGMPRDVAKKLILSVMNGGLDEYNQIQNKPTWLSLFKNEIQEIHTAIAEKNPELLKAVKATKAFNVNGSVMNHILCDIENTILCSCIEFLKLKGVSVENVVLVFDGFMLPKGLEIDLDAMTAYAEQKTGYSVQMVEKPMTCALDISAFPDPVIDENPFVEFEKSHFKVMNPLAFVRETKDTVQFLNKTELATMYQNLPDFDRHNTFINAWLKSPEMRTYEKVDILPPPLEVPSNIYNMWRGFPASRMPMTGSHELGIQHIRNLFPTSTDFNWIMTWLATIIQSPGRKTGVCPVIIGGQGAGKGFLFEQMMGRIMGSYFAHTSDPEHSLFARFAENRNGKILVNVDDCNVGAMKMNADPFKSFITGERIEYEQKGKQTISLLNCANFVMTTNNENPVKLDTDDRRYAVLACSKSMVGDVKYFEALRAYVEDDANIGALYKFFLDWDVSQLHLVKNRPMTQLYRDMKMLSADKELLYLGHLVQIHKPDKVDVSADDLYGEFRSWLNDSGYAEFKPRSKISFGMYLKKIEGIESVKRSVMRYVIDIPMVGKYLAKNGVDVSGVCLL